jgi:hypothetical protein
VSETAAFRNERSISLRRRDSANVHAASRGGLEVDPVTCARVIEEVARFDSATAWALQAGNSGA